MTIGRISLDAGATDYRAILALSCYNLPFRDHLFYAAATG